MIKFKVLRFKNLLSTGNDFTEIQLDTNKMTLIVGANGAGKSQMLDALTFVLFNKAFRKINKGSLINSINNKNCLVEIEFDIGSTEYKIVRGIKPNLFEIYANGVMVNQNPESKDYQEYLEKHILKTSFKSFTQIVVLGSATFTPFMRLTAADRREVLDDLLDIQIFTSMNVLAKQKMADLNKDIAVNNQNILGLNSKIQYINEQINLIRMDSDDHKKKLIEEIEKIIEEGKQVSKEITEVENKIKNTPEPENENNIINEMNQLLSKQGQWKNIIHNLNQQIGFYEKNDECNTCQQPIDKKFKVEIIENNKTEAENIKKDIDDLNNTIDKLRNRIKDIQNIKTTIQNLTTDKKILEQKRNNLAEKYKKINNEIKSLTNEGTATILNKNIDDKNNFEIEMQKAINMKQDFAEEKEVLDLGLKLLKDGGIKTQIVKTYIPIINKSVNKYLESMDFLVSFNLNENFDETIMSRYRDEFSYANFSEGEKARIDLSLMLTFRQIAKMRNSVNTNLLILDEVFDGSLDNTGSDELVSILKGLIKDCNVFVISHRDSMKDQFETTLNVKKINNFSVMEKENGN
jgi:DNA repair exonuclease SbcCD ATPase subunit